MDRAPGAGRESGFGGGLESERSGCSGCSDTPAPASEPVESRFIAALRYGYLELLPEIGLWLILGLILTAIVGAAVPDGLLENHRWAVGLPSMLLAIALGLPVYVCASGSTPLAAALVAKGLNPGAALVFLLTGPATNMATLTLVRRFYGPRFLRVYLATIAGVAIVAGLMLNALLAATGWRVIPQVGSETAITVGLLEVLAAVVLVALLVWSLARTGLRSNLAEIGRSMALLAWVQRALGHGSQRAVRLAGALAAVLVLIWLSTALTTIGPGEVGVKRHFGAVRSEPLPPGLHIHWPLPVDRVDLCPLERVQVLEIGFRMQGGQRLRDPVVARELDLVTGDVNLIDLTAIVEYRAADPVRFLYHDDDVAALVHSATVAAANEVLASESIDDVLTVARAPLQEAATQRTRALLADYDVGVEVVAVRLLDVHSPPPVHDAFRDVASAQEDRATAIHRALGERERSLATARGLATRRGADASAEAATRRALARGEAAAFTALSIAARQKPQATRTRLHLETLERVLPGRTKLIRPGAGAGDFELWLVDGEQAAGNGGGDAGTRIRVPVIPQRPGDPDSVEIDLDAPLPGTWMDGGTDR